MSRYFVRVRTQEQLDIVINWQQAEAILADFMLMDSENIAAVNSHAVTADIAEAAESKGADDPKTHIYYCLPYVSRQNRLSTIEQMIRNCNEGTGIVICNMDELAMLAEMNFKGPVIADSFLYAYNSQAIDFYRAYYPDMRFILSDELTDRELVETDRIRDKNRGDSFIYKIYGHQPLMVTAQCISRNYTNCSRKTIPFRGERGNSFCAVSQCSQCYSVIYNGNATSMTDKMSEISFANLLIDFTIESADQVKQVLDQISQKTRLDPMSASDRAEHNNNHDSIKKQAEGQNGNSRENPSGTFHKLNDNKSSEKERKITRGHHYRGVD